jgi:hypothetical protein
VHRYLDHRENMVRGRYLVKEREFLEFKIN